MKKTILIPLLNIIVLIMFCYHTASAACDATQKILYDEVYKPCYSVGKTVKTADECIEKALLNQPPVRNSLTKLISMVCMLGCADAVSGSSMQSEYQFCSER
ncbi:MAG: hypothetical protein JXK07_11395 [Spirochaetes bacterium]|nr:hypothetical protein [Spirochaetota bacterium]MBN2770860.1 hypothetical protein [Spirochaetota bacterium]